MYRHNLAYLESFLPQDTFFRCHRAFIVNLYRIDRIISKSGESLALIMNDQEHTEIRVSQSTTSKFRSLLNF
ncbi:MAG: LytTR family DNA-binding domain-containing protein [Bacillaceae bacterium]